MNVGVWLPEETATVFRRHVPKKKRSDWGKIAIEERLRREGAFDGEQSTKAAALLKSVPADRMPAVVLFVELLTLRPKDVEARLVELRDQSLETAGAAVGK